jgi:isoquinoline 1-oxidoreductase alpha subunit
MEIVINGKTYEVADEPDRPLLWILRDELGLTGTKFGCGVGICGSCEIHLGGTVARSCITSLSAAKGKAIRTIEGLASEGVLHPVQQAFLDEQVHQCGWCMSGQMMRAVALLEENPNPTEKEIVAAMNANYCRCGAYGRIKRAVASASRELAAASGEIAAASRETAAASREIAASSREIAASSGEVAAGGGS